MYGYVPRTEINKFLELLGSPSKFLKIFMIILSMIGNVVFNNRFIRRYMDEDKSDWEVVGLQLLYLILENIDNYAALCFGNISQDLVEKNPVIALTVGLIFGQLYGSDLAMVLINAAIIWLSIA